MKNVQDIYTLSPMQELMLLHAVSHGGNDTLFNQFCYRIDATIDVEAFQRAWQGIVHRHLALRSAFFWENVKQPVQVVREHAEVPVTVLDWRDRDQTAVNAAFQEFCDQDRALGFELQRAPLLRLTLIQYAEEKWFLVWSSHHLVLDRWCLGTLYRDFDNFYRAALSGEHSAPEASASFRNYIDWIRRQDLDAARDFWSTNLHGFHTPTRLAAPAGESVQEEASFTLDAAVLDQLRKFSRRSEVSLSTLFQGAWSLVLNRVTGAQDVLFGVTVAGRPVDIEDIEDIVGSFVNNLPQRVLMRADDTVKAWLKELQTTQLRRNRYEFLSPRDIVECSDLDDPGELFDTLLVWLAVASGPSAPALPLEQFGGFQGTAYPLNLSIFEEGERLTVHADSRQSLVQPLDEILSCLQQVLLAVAGSAAPEADRLGALPGFVVDPDFCEVTASRRPGVPRRQASSTDIDTMSGREKIDASLVLSLVTDAWQKALGLETVPADRDFFELGGSSLQAASVHLDIEAGTRQSIPLLALFRVPTIEGMAQALMDGNWPLQSSISQVLRATRNGVPLFCVASPEVSTIGYSLLTRHLSKRYNVYVLQAPPESDRVRKMDPAELPAIGRDYLNAMREIQPTGPYRMLGMCGGAYISLEMARHLDAEGEKTAYLGVINTWALYTVSKLYFPYQVFRRVKYYAKRIRDLVLKMARPAVPPTMPAESGHEAAVKRASEKRDSSATAALTTGNDDPSPYWITKVGFEALDPQLPKVPCEVTVYRLRRHSQQFWRIWDAGLGWSRQAELVRLIRIPGRDHKQVLRDEGSRAIAADINSELAPSINATSFNEAQSSLHEGQIS